MDPKRQSTDWKRKRFSFRNGEERNDKSSDAKTQKQPMKINRNGRKVEVKTESLSAMAEKEMTSIFNLNQEIRRLKPMYRERNQS